MLNLRNTVCEIIKCTCVLHWFIRDKFIQLATSHEVEGEIFTSLVRAHHHVNWYKASRAISSRRHAALEHSKQSDCVLPHKLQCIERYCECGCRLRCSRRRLENLFHEYYRFEAITLTLIIVMGEALSYVYLFAPSSEKNTHIFILSHETRSWICALWKMLSCELWTLRGAR